MCVCAELNFVNFPVDNQDLKIIARCNGKVLKTLELPGCTGITPLGISALCNGATALTKLDLARIPSVTDKALRSIARHLKKLESLRLSHTTKVSDRGTIMIIERCLLLRELYMGDMPFVTDKTCVVHVPLRGWPGDTRVRAGLALVLPCSRVVRGLRARACNNHTNHNHHNRDYAGW